MIHNYYIGMCMYVCSYDEAMDSIEDKIAKINAVLTEQGYHVSVGICRQEMSVDINEMIKQAEKQMYEEKNHYYEQKGIARRNQVRTQ